MDRDTMKRHIKISDFNFNDLDYSMVNGSYSAKNSALKYKDYLKRAYDDLVKDNTRFDNKTGITRNNEGVLSEFSNPSDHEPFKDMSTAKIWFCEHEVLCRASRYYNQHKLIG